MSTSLYPKSQATLTSLYLISPDTMAAPPRASYRRTQARPPSSQAAADAAPQIHELQHVHELGLEGRHRRRRILWWPAAGRLEPEAMDPRLPSLSPRRSSWIFPDLILIWLFSDLALLLYFPLLVYYF
jgi:hypothetical protein